MALVTGFTADRMLVIENTTVVDGSVVGDDLILERRDGTPINAGSVRGPTGSPGVTEAELNATVGSYTAWTPVIEDHLGQIDYGGATGRIRKGRYCRIGNVVFAYMQIAFGASPSPTGGSGGWTITNLPYGALLNVFDRDTWDSGSFFIGQGVFSYDLNTSSYPFYVNQYGQFRGFKPTSSYYIGSTIPETRNSNTSFTINFQYETGDPV